MDTDRIPSEIKERINEYDRNLDRWTYYEILFIHRNATEQDIKNAYRKLVGLMHPDRYGQNLDEEYKSKLERIFNEINIAYNTLREPSQRMKYDQQLYFAEDHGKPLKVDLDTQVAEAQYKRGIIALQKKEIVPAIEFFRSAVQLAPSNPEYLAKLALALSNHTNPRIRKEAFEYAREAVKLNHENPNYHALMGRLYQKQGELDTALVHYQRALSWNPHHQAARREIKAIKFEKSKQKPKGLKEKLTGFFGKKAKSEKQTKQKRSRKK